MVDPVGTTVASPEPELPEAEPGSDEVRPVEFSRTVELVAGIVVAIVSIGVVAWMSRDQWFLSDSWDFITTREIGSLDDLQFRNTFGNTCTDKGLGDHQAGTDRNGQAGSDGSNVP